MTDYILYHSGSLYCYRHGDYVSYWQKSITTAVTSRFAYMEGAGYVYGTEHIIYQSHLPITPETYPEYFL